MNFGAGAASSKYLFLRTDSCWGRQRDIPEAAVVLLENLELLFRGGIAHNGIHEEAVELSFGQVIRTLLFDRILRCKHPIEFWLFVSMMSDRDFFFPHRFNERRLHLCRRAIDFIRQQNVVEYRAAAKREIAFLTHIDFRTDQVGWQKVGRELD